MLIGYVVLDCLLLTGIGAAILAVNASTYPAQQFFAAFLGRPEMRVLPVALVVFFICQALISGYKFDDLTRTFRSVAVLIISLALTFAALLLLGNDLQLGAQYSKLWFLAWTASSLIILPYIRWFSIARFRRRVKSGVFAWRAISVGVGSPALGQNEITQVSHGLTRVKEVFNFERLDNFCWLEDLVREQAIDEIYISVPWARALEVLPSLEGLRRMSANVVVIPHEAGRLNLIGASMRDDCLQMHVVDRPIKDWAYVQKRALDVFLAALALLGLLPVMALVALAIKLESRGPVIFRQARVGFNGRKFGLLKFRSMYSDSTDMGASRQTSRDDNRVTRVGRWIRATSLDELPQFINVLLGDMSVVGPRPHALQTTAAGLALDEVISNYAARHRVKPGMTGLAQINGFRGALDTVEKLKQRVRYDMEYIDNWSLWLDLRIVLKTAFLVIHDPRAF